MKKIDFKKIEVENFLSIGNDTLMLDFKTGLNIITGINHDKDGSRNGVGKSSILESIYFCLFGTTVRELKKEEIVNNINKKKCRVKLYFDVTTGSVTDSYTLERKIFPTKLSLEKNGDDITESSMVKTTERVCNIIGASSDVFKNAVIMTVNGTIPFMAQSKVERRKFCEGLFNLGIFQDMLLESRKQYNEIKSEASVERAKLDEVNNSLQIYKTQQKHKTQYKKDRTDVLLQRKKNNIAELDELKTTIFEVKDTDENKYIENIKLLETKQKSTGLLVQKNIREIATKEEQIKTKKLSIKELKKFGDRCEECKRPFSENDKIHREEKILGLETEIDTLYNEIKTIEGIQTNNESIIEKCNLAIEKQKEQLSEIKHSIEKNANIEVRMNQLKSWNEQIKLDIEELEHDCKEINTIVNDTSVRANSLKTTIASMDKKMKVLDSVKYIVSEEGVKSYIIKKILAVLNGKISYYLNKMDAPCKFKFNEYFEEQIINEKGQECSYNNFSSGEKKRIDLAILFTFMDIRRLQGNTSINISFYDEVLDTSIDDRGIEMFLGILENRIDTYGESCYIITHKNNAIKSSVNDIILVEKKDGFTTIGRT